MWAPPRTKNAATCVHKSALSSKGPLIKFDVCLIGHRSSLVAVCNDTQLQRRGLFYSCQLLFIRYQRNRFTLWRTLGCESAAWYHTHAASVSSHAICNAACLGGWLDSNLSSKPAENVTDSVHCLYGESLCAVRIRCRLIRMYDMKSPIQCTIRARYHLSVSILRNDLNSSPIFYW